MEKVTLYCQKSDNSDEKIIRKGILSKPKNPKANVVLCHGFTCDKNDIGFMRYMFKDCNCLTFDFRAHGENIDGQFCTLGKNEAYDVRAAFDFLKAHPATKGLVNIVYAFSMGSVSAIEAQARFGHLYDAGIFDCPFDSTENVISRGLDNKKITLFGYEFDIPGKIILRKYLFHPYVQSFVKAMLTCAEQLNGKSVNTFVCPVCTAESIKKVDVPSLFILCKNDEKISIDNIKSIYYNSPARYKKLLLTEGKKHFGSFFNNPEVYAEKIENFVSKVISGQLYLKNKHKIVEEPTEIEDIKGSIEIVDNKKIKDIDKLKGATEIAVAVKDVKLTKQAFK
jgi:pimeloyl-ACP methyl ester carboxylesterase